VNTVIISDLHLKEESREITKLFKNFLDQIARYSEELIILGDFFEYWIGDDAINNFQKNIADLLKNLNQQYQTKIFIMPGNRDLLIGQKFCDLAGACLLPEIVLRDFSNSKIILCHGDQLCTSDIRYQKYRKQVHKFWVQRLFLALPIFIRREIAKKIRKSSREKFKKYPVMIDVSPEAVCELAEQYQAEILIHGHTHQKIYELAKPGSKLKYRIVNSDWNENQGSFIQIDQTGIYLKDFPQKSHVKIEEN